MKYIRTEDGVFGPLKNNDSILKKGTFFGKPILRQEDIIDELFDAYVGVDDNVPQYMSKAVYKTFKHKISKRNVYGAIWVFDSDDTPTLKPVAKMNEKGKWILI